MIDNVRRSCLVVALLLVTACGTAQVPAASPSPATSAPSPVTATPALTAATAAPPSLPHVFVIVMENTGFARAMKAPSIASLAAKNALATNYHAVARPSLPNYLAMTSGSTHGITDNGYYSLPAGDIGTQLTNAGIPWRAYMEGMTSAGCMRSPYPYALRHNPFAYYGGACPANVVPLEALDGDLAGNAPNFVWITPGLCHDAHDCPIEEAGVWLEGLVSRITASRAWSERGILFIAWDEGDGADTNRVPLIVATKRGLSGELTASYDHYSLLATIEDLFRLPRQGAAANARSLVDVLGID